VNERRRFRPRTNNNSNRGRRGGSSGGNREPVNNNGGGEWNENEPVNEQDLDTTMSFSPDEGGDGAPVSTRAAASGDDAGARQGRKNALDMALLDKETLDELRERAKEAGIPSYTRLKKDDLIVRLLRAQAERNGFELRGGVIDVVDDNIGFLRAEHYLPGPDDIYVSPSQIKRFGVRTGDMVIGQVRPPKDSEKYYSLLRVEAINGQEPEQAKSRPHFEKLTPIFPLEAYDIASSGKLSMRLLSLVSPIGKGQRGLIVAPPKVGKNTHQLQRRAHDGRADRRAPGRSN
jgi:hypothetical protein